MRKILIIEEFMIFQYFVLNLNVFYNPLSHEMKLNTVHVYEEKERKRICFAKYEYTYLIKSIIEYLGVHLQLLF